jgi:putative MATE family efflux protein
VVAFALPMLAGNLLQTAYSFINAFWVGKFLGSGALAAITVSMPALFVMMAAAAGLTLATNILVAQCYGARDWPGLRRAVQTSVALIAGTSLALLALTLVFADRLLALINTPPDIFAAAASYLRVILWTVPLSFSVFLLGSMLRGIGDSKTPVYFQAISVALNTLLDPLLMFGLIGLPRLGLNGTAWATLASQAGAVVGLLVYVPRRRPLVMPQWSGPRPDRATAWLLIRIGVPAMIQQSVVSVSMLVIVSLVSAFGSQTDAAFGAALRIDQVAFLPALTVGLAVSSLAGQNIGARQYQRVRQVFWWGVLLSGGISLVISVFAITLPGIILRIFLNEPAVIAIGAQYLRIVGISYVLYSVLFVSNGIINGAGHTFATTLISVANLWGIRLPLAVALPHYFHGPIGIWYAMLSSVGCGMVMSLGYYASGRWRRPVLKPGLEPAGPPGAP